MSTIAERLAEWACALSLQAIPSEVIHQAQFSLPYALACALRYRSFGVAQMNEPSFADPHTLAVMEKVRMIRNDALEATEEGRRQNPEGARVTLTLHDGRALKSYNGAATGMPSRPMPDEALDAKFLACATMVLAPTAARALLAKLRHLERREDARMLFAS